MNKNTKNFYEKVTLKTLQDMATEYNANDDLAFVRKRAKKSDAILDLGCGWGRMALALAGEGYEHITGIDISQKLIREAKRQVKKENLLIHFDVGSMTSLPYQKGSFNKIFCLWNSFNEILDKKDQARTLKEAFRVLKPGGKAFFILINGEADKLETDVVLERPLKGKIIRQYAYSKDALDKLAEQSPFSTYSIRSIQMHGRKRLLLSLEK